MPWEITGNTNTNEQTNFIGTTDQHAFVIKTNGTEAIRVDPTGNVGVGTHTPNARVEIVGKLQIDAQDAVQIVGYQPFLTLIDSENNGTVRARIQNARGDINFFTEASFGSGIPPMKIQNTGTVQMFAQDALQIIGYQPFLTLIDSENNGAARARIQNARGDIAFFTEGSLASGIPPMKINNANGNVEIATDIALTGADCAEDFDVVCPEQIEPGTVVVINREGALAQSQEAYDKKVAGVVSGAGDYKPGMILDRRAPDENRKSIALFGKVFCKVDASGGPIDVGDLLTSSSVAGHAMRAADPLRAFGAVIGKALKPLAAGRGLIPILIALQ